MTTSTIATKLTNNAAKVSSMTAALYNKGLQPVEAVVLATALITCEERMPRGLVKWNKRMSKAIRGAEVVVANQPLDAIDITLFTETLVSADLIVIDIDADTVVPGEYLIQLNEPTMKHYPTPVTEALERRHNYGIQKPSKLMIKCIHALEGTQSTVDVPMVTVALLVAKEFKDDEAYVLEGCEVLMQNGNVPTIAEFKADDGGRVYQAACHGPNGQSSDRSRSFMNLHGVPTTYDAVKARAVILEEMDDMCQNVEMSRAKIRMLKSYSKFIISELKLEGASTVKKPWSFVKCVLILNKLDKHIANPSEPKPYIGMAFGLDAKCSGPQYGALMVGDTKLAAACGFSKKKVADAYERAVTAALKLGFKGLTRAAIKTPFMATVYGQGAASLCNEETYDMTDPADVAFWNAIYDDDYEVMLAKCRSVRSAIIKSLGKLGTMMQTVKNAHGVYDDDGQMQFTTDKATKFMMPDGQCIAPRYKVMVDIFGDLANDLVPDVDVQVSVNNEVFIMKALKFKTQEVDLGKYQRTGLVRLIHSVDGLIARLIVTHLEEMGAQHIIAIHDCFRVNICDYLDGKLHRAIEEAYLDLFGSDEDESQSEYLESVDMLKMYFEGVAKASKLPTKFSVTQFDIDGDRMLDEIEGETVYSLIMGCESGETYYFAK